MSARFPIGAALIALLAGAARGDEPSTFEAAGQAPIVNGDAVKARERALDESFRQAIDEAIAALPEQPLPRAPGGRASLLQLKIYPKARSYVTTYRVLEEGEQGGTFRIRISAQVASGRLAQDLASNRADEKAAPPTARIAVCLAERSTIPLSQKGGSVGEPLVAGALLERLASAVAAAGAEPVAAPGACAASDADDLVAFARADDGARAAGARGALVGRIELSPAGEIRGTSLTTAHAAVRLALVEDAGGQPRLIGPGASRAEHEAWGEGAIAAARAAAGPALDEALATVAGSIAERWPGASAGVAVHLDGAGAWSDVVALQKALAEVPGVSGVELRRFSQAGVELLARGRATAPSLAGALGRAAGSRFAALAHGDKALAVRVVPPPAPAPTTAAIPALPSPAAAAPTAAPAIR